MHHTRQKRAGHGVAVMVRTRWLWWPLQPGVAAKAATMSDEGEKLVWKFKYQDLHRQFENACAQRDSLLSELRTVKATLATTAHKLQVSRRCNAVKRPHVASAHTVKSRLAATASRPRSRNGMLHTSHGVRSMLHVCMGFLNRCTVGV